MDGQSWNILLIDNDDREYEILEKLLRKIGHPYTFLWIDYDNFIADIVSSGQFQVIFIDQNLGRVSGVDVLDQLQQRGLRAPVILLRDKFTKFSEDEILAKGACAVIEKRRLNEKTLQETIQSVLQFSCPPSPYQSSFNLASYGLPNGF